MRVMTMLCLLGAVGLGACAGPISAERRAAAQDDLNPSGRPIRWAARHPLLQPLGDSSFTPLRCHLEGPGQVCDRSGS